MLVLAFLVAPASIAAGVIIKATQSYRLILWAAWSLLILGIGLLTILGVDDSLSLALGILVLPAFGLGVILTSTYFPVLAPRMSSNKLFYKRN
jgi:hypothetical protein